MNNYFDEQGEYIPKAENALLDYPFKWTRWLTAVSDTIASATVIISPTSELTIENLNYTDNIVTVWLSGGMLNKTYKVLCKIVTVGGREDERTMRVKVISR